MENKFLKLFDSFYLAWILGSHKTKTLTLFVSMIDIWWALILMLPYETYKTSHSFDLIGSVISENNLAVICGILGGVLLYSKAKNHYLVFKLAIIANVIFWFFIAWSFLIGNPISTGAGVYFIVALMCGVIYLRNKADG